MVYLVKDTTDFKAKLAEAGEKLIVVDFFATWCGPCKMIAPKLEQMAEEYSNVVFMKIDVDECEDLAMEYSVSSMPTFLFIKNGTTLDTVVGANADRIKSMIEKHK